MDAAEDDEATRHASQRLAEALRTDIDAGRYRPGDRLPSYRALAREHDIAVNTAQAAMRLLAADGRVTVRKSAGAFVAERSDDGKQVASVTISRDELAVLHRQVERARRALAEVDRALADLSDRATRPVGSSDSTP
ncbi:GntR family transcriptional regulator [Pseudonocardia acidicola]|uniref:Winged helix-turn-helix transcriptional regulator n=1 Tax=Pseudonocardia acidicola TaxID=2724939 RepID=A0ABX1SJA9_9PSEU|nr:winged helix-turn-helix domain-containing protein [Pseudonocardia acidicola]NMI01055.1 winged helix-turn-helix transcriptional regulator [Pseudonocardia acidicola]